MINKLLKTLIAILSITLIVLVQEIRANDNIYSEQYIAKEIIKNANKFNIDARVIFTLINIESAFNPFAIAVETNRNTAMMLKKLESDNIVIRLGKTYHSKIYLVSIFPKNESDAIFIITLLKKLGFCFDVGLMQINSGNFSKKDVAKMMYPSVNIKKGVKIFTQCTRQFADFKHQVECYNRGAGNLKKALKKGKHYSPYFKQFIKKYDREF